MSELVGPKGVPLLPRQARGLRLLGVQLRAARLGRGWSQRGLERASGVDQTTISRLENGQLRSLRLPRIGDLMAALEGDWRILGDVPRDARRAGDATNGIADGDDRFRDEREPTADDRVVRWVAAATARAADGGDESPTRR